MAKKDKHEQHDAEARAPAKMKRKEYERQMRILHVQPDLPLRHIPIPF